MALNRRPIFRYPTAGPAGMCDASRPAVILVSQKLQSRKRCFQGKTISLAAMADALRRSADL